MSYENPNAYGSSRPETLPTERGEGIGNTEGYGTRRPDSPPLNTQGDTYGSGRDRFTDSDRQGGYGGNITGESDIGRPRDNDNSYGSSNDRGADSYGSSYGRDTDATQGHEYNTGAGHKPTIGEKFKGTFETAQGKLTKNPELVERGQERKAGELGNNY